MRQTRASHERWSEWGGVRRGPTARKGAEVPTQATRLSGLHKSLWLLFHCGQSESIFPWKKLALFFFPLGFLNFTFLCLNIVFLHNPPLYVVSFFSPRTCVFLDLFPLLISCIPSDFSLELLLDGGWSLNGVYPPLPFTWLLSVRSLGDPLPSGRIPVSVSRSLHRSSSVLCCSSTPFYTSAWSVWFPDLVHCFMEAVASETHHSEGSTVSSCLS